jgi:hypothetical protein
VQSAAPPPSPCAGQRGPLPSVSQSPSLSCTARTGHSLLKFAQNVYKVLQCMLSIATAKIQRLYIK